MSLLLITGIELLTIKDMYSPDRMTPSLFAIMIAFGFTLGTSVFLILSGLSTLGQRLGWMRMPVRHAGKLLLAFLAKPFA